MKKIILTLILCTGIFTVWAQSETQSFDAYGIKVIFKPTTKNVINVRLYFRGGVTNYPATQAGIEDIALDATTKCGTKKYSPTAFKDTLDKYDIEMYGSSTYDYGFIQLNCVSKYFATGWEMFSEAVTSPVFNNEELRLLKEKAIAFNKDHEANPDNHLASVQIKNAFKNTPYATDPGGTEETLNAVTADDVKSYYKTLLNKNKMFIVVVGNITKQELFEKILLAFGNVAAKPYTSPELQTPVFNDNKVYSASQFIATNYVSAMMNAPDFTSTNYIPYRLGLSGLGGNLFQSLRSRLKLSYSPYSEVHELRMPFSTLTAGTNDIQAVTNEMFRLVKQIQQYGLTEEWLQHIKNTYITRSYINDQSAAAITNNLGRAEILGNWQYADDLTKLVQMTTVEQVNNALNLYIVGLRWTILGSPENIGAVKPPAYY